MKRGSVGEEAQRKKRMKTCNWGEKLSNRGKKKRSVEKKEVSLGGSIYRKG